MVQNIPVVEVNRDNLATFWPTILLAAKNAQFLAMDVELSGLGDRKRLIAKSIDERYKSLADASSSRSILSLGLSCFASTNESSNSQNFKVQTFNFLTLCADDFVVEPAAVQFLVDHGFDFNLQYSRGLPYRRGIMKNSNENSMNLRRLFKEILSFRKPIVVHNGLVDLVFLYSNFVTDLPSSLQIFVADLAELFPGGVYDTKFVADFCARFQASYLEYVFRKCQRENETETKANRKHISIQLPNFTSNVEKWIEWADFSSSIDRAVEPGDLCPIFSAHGWCKEGVRCSLSHDVDAILDLEDAKLEKKRAKKRRRRKNDGQGLDDAQCKVSPNTLHSAASSSTTVNGNGSVKSGTYTSSAIDNGSVKCVEQTSLPLYTGAHRAGYDAFMAGFSLVYLALKVNNWTSDEGNFDVPLFKNKIALSGKDYPLCIQASAFAKLSGNMQEFLKLM